MSDEAKHTPEQLTFEIVPSDQRERAQPYSEWTGLYIGVDDLEGGMTHTLFEGGFTHGPKDGDPEADAKRLVVCWNACAGIPTEELTEGCMGRMLYALGRAQAAVWDAHYGNGIAVEYARKVDAEINAALPPLQKGKPQ